MQIGLGGAILLIWVVAILFGGQDTRAAAWDLAINLAALAVVLVLVLGLILLVEGKL